MHYLDDGFSPPALMPRRPLDRTEALQDGARYDKIADPLPNVRKIFPRWLAQVVFNQAIDRRLFLPRQLEDRIVRCNRGK